MSSKRDDLADFEDSKPPAKKAKSSSPKTKRPNKKKGNGDASVPSDMTLPVDAFTLVMEFLHPRDLLNTASTCKG